VSVLGKEAFSRLHELKVAIVGTSRTGSLMAERLAHTYGVHNFVLVDPDRFELHNFAEASALLKPEEHVGQYKTDAVASVLRSRYGAIVSSRPEPLQLEARRLITEVVDCDLIVTTTDTVSSRFVAGWIASLYHLTHLDIGIRIVRRPGRQTGPVDTQVNARIFFPGYHNECIYCREGLHTRGLGRLHMAAVTQPVGSLTSLAHVAVGFGLRLLEEGVVESLDGTSHVQVNGFTSETAGTDSVRIDPPGDCFCAFAGGGDTMLPEFERFRSVMTIDR